MLSGSLQDEVAERKHWEGKEQDSGLNLLDLDWQLPKRVFFRLCQL